MAGRNPVFNGLPQARPTQRSGGSDDGESLLQTTRPSSSSSSQRTRGNSYLVFLVWGICVFVLLLLVWLIVITAIGSVNFHKIGRKLHLSLAASKDNAASVSNPGNPCDAVNVCTRTTAVEVCCENNSVSIFNLQEQASAANTCCATNSANIGILQGQTASNSACCSVNSACCASNTASIGALQTQTATNTASIGLLQTIVSTLSTFISTTFLSVSGNVTVGANLTAANVTVTDTLTVRKFVFTNYSLPDLSQTSARVIALSCTDMGNSSIDPTLSFPFEVDFWNRIAAIMPPTSGALSRPAMVMLMGDQIYSDGFEPEWYASWQASHPNVNVSLIGDYSQVLGYYPFTTNSSENINGWIRQRDNMIYKYGLYRNISSFVALNNSGRVTAFWDDHDYGFDNSGNNFAHKAESKQLFGNAFGDSWWVYKRNTGTEGIFGVRTLTLADKRTIDLFVLDDQFYRDVYEVLAARGAKWDDEDTVYFGDTQLAWLETALLASGATFRVIFSGSPIFVQDGSNDNAGHPLFVRTQYYLVNLLQRLNMERTFFVGGDSHILEMIEDHRISPMPIINVISSGVDHNTTSFYDPLRPERTYVNWDQTAWSGFVVFDFALDARDPCVIVSFCRAIVGQPGVTVLNQYTLLARDLTFGSNAALQPPATSDVLEPYVTYFAFTILDARTSHANQLNTPAYLSMYDDTDGRLALPPLPLKPTGTSGIISSLARDIRAFLQVGHNYTCTITINSVVDTFEMLELEPLTRFTRYFLNVLPTPIDPTGMTQVAYEDFTEYTVGQALVFTSNGSSAPNAPNWSGDQVRSEFVNPTTPNQVVFPDSNVHLQLLGASSPFTRIWYHDPAMNTVSRSNRNQLYVSMRVWPLTHLVVNGAIYLYLVSQWDPVGNPVVGGPGVTGVECAFFDGNVRVTPFSAGGTAQTSGRVSGFYPLLDLIDNFVIEILMDFTTNILSIAVDGTNYEFSASILSPVQINGIGAVGIEAMQPYYIDYIDVRSS